jgi:hypothetical protein
MNVKNRIARMGLILVSVLIVGFLSMFFYSGNNNEGRDISNEAGQAFLFARPVFAQSTTPTFLDEEAGISLYVNIGHSIDLGVAKTVYRTLEKETADYIVGSIALPGLTENEDVHCFVQKDGWIVTYYLEGEPISKVVDWNLWLQNTSKLTENKLQVGLKQMTNTLGALVTSVKYYHFQYPNANKCMIILETLVGSGEDSFNITIPNDINVYERSWSHYSQDIRQYYGNHQTDFKIDTIMVNSIYNVADPVTQRGTLLVAQLFPGQGHVVSISSNYAGSNLYGVCVALAYQEP